MAHALHGGGDFVAARYLVLVATLVAVGIAGIARH
jgi:hypothetical protein